MKVKLGLCTRFVIIFLATAILLSLAAAYVTATKMRESIWNQYQKHAIETANLGVSFIDGDAFERYSVTLTKDDQYEKIQRDLNRIRRTSNIVYLYAIQLLPDNKDLFVFDTWEEDTPEDQIVPLGSIFSYNSNYTEITKPLTTKKTTEKFEITRVNEFGTIATIYAPIINSKGEVVGVLGVDTAMYDIESTVKNAVKNLCLVIFPLILFFFVVLLIVVRRSFIRPIRVLKSCVEEMAEGKLEVQAPVKGNTEITEISRAFNRMSLRISAHLKEMESLNEGYYKFIPAEIFTILQKEDVTQVRLGDNRKVTMSVLSMGIRDFKQLARTMEAQELFSLINSVYREVVPPVKARDGVIGEFYKGGFLAFYETECQKALDSAVEICQRFHKARETVTGQGKEAPDLSFGIGYGMVLLGIVGQKQRLDVSMMSEQITAAEHLNNVAWKYRSRILITGAAAERIPDFAAQYASRFVGMIRFKVSGKLDRFYDVYEGDSAKDRELKDLTKDKFEEGVEKFLKKQFYEARLCFIEVLKSFREDYAAREYLSLCDKWYRDAKEAKAADVFMEEC